MTREKIGEVYTDENGKAEMSFDISEITEDFTLEAVYDQFSDSESFENITYELTIEADDTTIDSGDTLTLTGELLGNNTLVDGETTADIYINGQKTRTTQITDGEFTEEFLSLPDGKYEIYVSWKNARVVSPSITVYIGTVQLTLSSEKQIIDDGNSITLTGNLNISGIALPNTSIGIYDGSTLLATKTTNNNGNFSHTITNIVHGLHLYKAISPETESKKFEVVAKNDEEIIITVTGNTINFGDTGANWLGTDGNATIYWGDGQTNTVNNPTTNLSHTYTDNINKHLIVITGDIEEIGDCFLYEQDELTEIIIPSENNITAINDYAFFRCVSLEEIKIPDTIETLGKYAFSGCSELNTVILNENITSIGNNCFDNCPSIIDYQLYWEGTSNIIQYSDSKFSTNLLTVFTVPNGEKNNYITKNYPNEKIQTRVISVNVISNKADFNLGDTIVVNAIIREGGLLAPNKTVYFDVRAPLTNNHWTFSRTTNSEGRVIFNLQLEVPTDLDIKATCGDSYDVLNLNGYIYKNDLTSYDENWEFGFDTDLNFNFSNTGLFLSGYGDETDFILNKKLFNDGFYPINIEYELKTYYGAQYLINHLIDSSIENKIIELKNKPYGVQGTILDEYPNTDNWIDKTIPRDSHVKIKINDTYIILYVNNIYYLMKRHNYEDLINGYFSFAVQNGTGALYKNLKIEYMEEYELTAYSDKDSVDYGETARIYLTLLRTDGTAAANKKIHINMLVEDQSIYSGTVISDNYGQCSFPYTGTNAGTVDIIMEYSDTKAEVTIEDGNGKTNTEITLTEPSESEYVVGDTITVSGVLTDNDGEPLANKTIKIDTQEVE